jgi:exopolysaccharide biosynthesis operon protein EpsL
MTLPGRALVALALGVCAVAHVPQARALLGDRLELFASETITYDSNPFRLSKGVNNFNALGNNERSDLIFTTTGGFNLNVPVSRQRFIAGLTLNRVDYSRFEGLNHTGRDGRAVWLWEVGDRFNGAIGVTDNRSITSFLNFTVQARDLVTTQTAFANANWLVNPSWRLRVGVDGLKQEHSEQTRQEQNINVTGTEGAITYISRAGNSIGLMVRHDDATYPNRQAVGGATFDNAYTQRAGYATLDWAITPRSRVSGRVGAVKRDYENVTARNFSGGVYRAVYDWTPGGRFSIAAIAQRDILVFEDIRTSFVLAQGVALRPAYRFSDKLNIEGTLDYSKRDYLGDVAVATGATAQQREDKIFIGGVAATWQYSRNLQFVGSVSHERRRSNIQFGDYEATIVFVRGRIGF